MTAVPFRVVYADPPWTYTDRCHAGERGAAYKYPTMTVADICRMPVRELVADDAVLFIWATYPMLTEAVEVMYAWGFEYKTIAFSWVKTRSAVRAAAAKALRSTGAFNDTDRAGMEHVLDVLEGAGVLASKLHWGMGNYTRANTEPCLLGVRGKRWRESASVHQVVMAPLGRHSAKPAEVRDRIVQLCGDVPRVELFARERAQGWDAWGAPSRGKAGSRRKPADGTRWRCATFRP